MLNLLSLVPPIVILAAAHHVDTAPYIPLPILVHIRGQNTLLTRGVPDRATGLPHRRQEESDCYETNPLRQGERTTAVFGRSQRHRRSASWRCSSLRRQSATTADQERHRHCDTKGYQSCAWREASPLNTSTRVASTRCFGITTSRPSFTCSAHAAYQCPGHSLEHALQRLTTLNIISETRPRTTHRPPKDPQADRGGSRKKASPATH